ncbi:UDP-N-acetylmuramoyl-L-alanyl-D-glutamate--2,6-diaminopimelate ligase [Candidatus Bealeia paramacronuclearis]|uniref:UDP-N-acetylmuramoyl-L-alanyl-D-glutamate--2,6-diaminopimelate ligase n=1 Tax=Candidatus Bealeia paramacronuclearis TaxID=1921001 RepID=A0ABZ2C064_9PROT|nr:UDP-N-acetylmuramoyl-L-alanyl-D-glutamate--2,6-diaminopimelate ligase [Candidatus Bealeia paramacronuclearis]
MGISLKSCLIDGLIYGVSEDLPDLEIQGLTPDSRRVQDGFLFAAILGAHTHGGKFIKDAVGSGAKVILADMQVAVEMADIFANDPRNIVFLKSPNVRKALSVLAGKFYPKTPQFIAAVTGTNGKSSVVTFARQLWGGVGQKAASFGTLGLQVEGISKEKLPTLEALTTPNVVELRETLEILEFQGVEHCAFEASSHGLDQYRLDDVNLTVGVFTNFTRDHLDYHKSMQSYFAAKMRLFNELLSSDGLAILCADDPKFEDVKAICESRNHSVWSYGKQAREFKLLSVKPDHKGQHLKCEIFGKTHEFYLPFAGSFQALNILASIGVVLKSGVANLEHILECTQKLEGVPGRMECAGLSPQKSAYVDYAHTPDALENALKALRPHAENRLILVFGCGGDRDVTKRPLMGQIARRYADKIIVTDDNPRSENPMKIRQAILKTCPEAIEIGDREEAIYTGIQELKSGDILLVAGKGHEAYQIIGNDIRDFDDVKMVQKYWCEGGCK